MKGLGVLLLVTFVLAEPPYPPSGGPPGERLRLPIRKLKQEALAPVPHTVYGPPSTEAPDASGYLPPDTSGSGGPYPEQPANEYGPPEEPANEYGPPQQTDNEQPDNGYGPPQQPDNGYGPPQQPDNEYGPPQQPDDQFGAPENPDYETPEGSGQLPVEQGASERLRQKQFNQQLPHFEPARFRPQQNNRLRQPVRQQNYQSQRLQQPSQKFRHQNQNTYQSQRNNFQSQNFAPQRSNFQTQNFAPQRSNFQTQNFAPQRSNYQSQNFRQVPQNSEKALIRPAQNLQTNAIFESQKLPLYTTPKPSTTSTTKIVRTRKAKPARPATTEGTIAEAEGPNIAVATAFSGRYYVLQPDGLLQEVTYKLENGQVTDGRITPNLKLEQLAPIKEPIYTFNAENRLVRIS